MIWLIFVTNDTIEPLNNIKSLEINEEVNGDFTLSLTSFFHENNPGHNLLKEESIITVDDNDFRVKQVKENYNHKTVVAISVFYDLTGKRQDDIYGGTRTFNQFASFVFGGTGWTYESVDVMGSMFIPNFGVDNIIKLVQALAQVFECEYKIMPGKHIVFKKEIGSDNDAQYRYGHNVQALSKSVDTTNLRTFIKGFGGNNLAVSYTSPNAVKFGIIEADPVEDDRFTNSSSLVEHIKKELVDYPLTSIELDSVELTNKELGERVWLIYEPLNIEYQTRIMSKKSVLRNGEIVTASVVIGNATPKKLSDVLTDQAIKIDENNKQTVSRFEQTNDRISLEVEEIGVSLASINIRADNIVLQVEAVDRSVAAVDIKADNINLSVNSRITNEVSAIDIKANGIVLSVSNLSGRVGTAESNIDIQAGQITSKVSSTDYNGNTMLSMISQTSSNIKIQAKNIDLDGITRVNGHLQIGVSDNSSKSLKFYFPGGSSEIIGESGVYGGGLRLNASDITLNAGDYLTLGTSNTVTRLSGTLNLTGATVQGLTATARLG